MSWTWQNSTKNNTRIASVLGTWTAQTHLKSDIGSYELMSYFVLHLMPDPMRGYGCFSKDCDEVQNQACVVDDDKNHRITSSQNIKCVNLVDNQLIWSDVVAFIYFGARVDVGFPFNKHREEDTGGWIGPINIILAQNTTSIDEYNSKISKKYEHYGRVIDRYVTRYVESPTTSYLRMPPGCSLLNDQNFRTVVGDIAVRETVKQQFPLFQEEEERDDETSDPYEKYLNTCDNGDVKPTLPIFDFDFSIPDDSNTGEERIDIKSKFKLLTMPHKKDYMYNIYPLIQKKFNNANLGFHISGPYCYDGDPKSGYTFDMNIDTRNPNAAVKLGHGCIAGLPCIPPAAELYSKSWNSNHVEPPFIPDNVTTLSLWPFVVLGLGLVYLSYIGVHKIYKYFTRSHNLLLHSDHEQNATQPLIDSFDRSVTEGADNLNDQDASLISHCNQVETEKLSY